MQVKSQIRHQDGTLGTVTFIHDGVIGERLIEWKSCGQYRVSNESFLKVTEPQSYRWRNNSR